VVKGYRKKRKSDGKFWRKPTIGVANMGDQGWLEDLRRKDKMGRGIYKRDGEVWRRVKGERASWGYSGNK